jgi:hypothetical protein
MHPYASYYQQLKHLLLAISVTVCVVLSFVIYETKFRTDN